MKLTPQITLRDIPHSEAVETKIAEKIEKLETYYSRIMSCRVAVEASQRRRTQGKLFKVMIDISVPGKELVINRIENEDLYVAIRDAFSAASRKVEEFSRKQRGEVKMHEEVPRGRVARIHQDDGYGFIETDDGREVYFHRNSVIDAEFDKLEEGFEVAFLEEQGKKGPQAIRVSVKNNEVPA
ncbi:MAG TPA: 30S ribosomal protein S30 [Nitrospiraceae bacterium]|nr:30S ribosomal protein S30 [Nitrospiraceae bacterium]